MSPADLLLHGDAVSATVAWVLLLMSVCSWIVIIWKSWFLYRGRRGLARSVAAFWQAPDWDGAVRAVATFDGEDLVSPLLRATQQDCSASLAGSAARGQQLTRVLRDALHAVVHRLQAGQVVLATVGSTAPFVGLLGTVWGIYHALLGLSTSAQITIDRLAVPVGESLVMTAAGLVVAIPAVLGYNALGRSVGRMEADLEGFAYDLRELLSKAES